MTDSAQSAAPAKPEPDLSGKELGDYRLLRRLGRGAMAEVYLAEQVSLRRMVAIKVLLRSLASDESYVRRFHHEAQSAASLVHANIVQIHEVGCIDGIHYIAQEYVPGVNLAQFLARNGAVDVRLGVAIIRQVTAALHRAAERGIVHRDIKPANIMLAANGEVKVADFGLARAAGEGSTVNQTQIGVTMGTPLYMSPEQVEGRPLDTRSDIYSFGVTSYEMLAGRPPFEGTTALSVAVHHLKTTPPRLENIRPGLPPGLCRLVHRMLEKDPAERFQNASQLLGELRSLQIEGADASWTEGLDEWNTSELLALMDARTAATQRLDAVMKTSAHATRRRGGVWLVAALIGALLAGGAVAWSTRESSLLDPLPGHPVPQIDKRESAEAQYIYAAMLNTEDAWRSVFDYFPPEGDYRKNYFARRAQEQLARLYVQQEEYDKALAIYDELINLDPTEEQFRIRGKAGKVIVLALQGNDDEARNLIPEVYERRNRYQLDSETRDEIEGLYRRLSNDNGSPTNGNTGPSAGSSGTP